jgi:SAM-dependent methyltransferase
VPGGTGPGIPLEALGGLRPDLRFVGIDHARHNLTGLRNRVELHTADGASLPLADGRFDLVVSTYSSHHWEDPEAGAAEIVRVLRGGGRLIVYDFPRAPFDALTRYSGLQRVRATRFRTGWGPLMKTIRFEAAAS